MKKIAILTINDNNNYGNRLQNYATVYILNKLGFDSETVLNINISNFKLRNLKNSLKFLSYKKNHKRQFLFYKFNKNIKTSKYIINRNVIPNNLENYYDFFVTGSDQVWNPYNNRLTEIDLLSFVDSQKRISLSASLGVSEIDEESAKKIKREISKFKAISVRENSGCDIIRKITNRNDVETLIDPTMMLSAEEWMKLSKKPKYLKNNKFVLTYFLGSYSDERQKLIKEYAKKNNYIIINLEEQFDEFYYTGPSEFIFLHRNAEMIFTDSFHSCVFSIVFQKAFIVFDRVDNKNNMGSRIDTLLSQLELLCCKYRNGKSISDYEIVNYTNCASIIELLKSKFNKFILNNVSEE